ncbi:hypothetical protein GGE67_001860 [Rhizobium leucaenae]|uniref:Uncharacterized protein n=1 Tax=Rhizobium leucaenae TaxID=29450 RepID=A0A7W7EK07_9HYPH|nr:hypothetical protein [Rhizobium leucaenae]MBB6301254.1 hypothetical protein [Rhizobium leucaenae]
MLGDNRHEKLGFARKQAIEGLLGNSASRRDEVHDRAAIAELMKCRAGLGNDLCALCVVTRRLRTTARAASGGLIRVSSSRLRPRFHLNLKKAK